MPNACSNDNFSRVSMNIIYYHNFILYGKTTKNSIRRIEKSKPLSPEFNIKMPTGVFRRLTYFYTTAGNMPDTRAACRSGAGRPFYRWYGVTFLALGFTSFFYNSFKRCKAPGIHVLSGGPPFKFSSDHFIVVFTNTFVCPHVDRIRSIII